MCGRRVGLEIGVRVRVDGRQDGGQPTSNEYEYGSATFDSFIFLNKEKGETQKGLNVDKCFFTKGDVHF